MKPGELTKELKIIWPGLTGSHSIFKNFNGEPKVTNENFIKNQLFLDESGFNSNSKFLIHYTSLKSLFEIISTGKLRLYNLLNLNDPFEMDYLKNQCNVNTLDSLFIKAKRHVFSISFNGTDSPSCEDYTMWRLYGDNGKGVAIVFEINNIEDYYGYLIGKVNYGISNEIKEKLIETFRILDKSIQDGVNQDEFPEILKIIFALFKDPRWKIENEIRLLTVLENFEFSETAEPMGNPAISSSFKQVISHRMGATAFIEYPIYESSLFKSSFTDTNILGVIPHLKINSIIIGPEISKENFLTINNQIQANSLKIFDTLLNVVQSKFKI